MVRELSGGALEQVNEAGYRFLGQVVQDITPNRIRDPDPATLLAHFDVTDCHELGSSNVVKATASHALWQDPPDDPCKLSSFP